MGDGEKHCGGCVNAGFCIVHIELGDLQATDLILENLASKCKEFSRAEAQRAQRKSL